MSKIKVRVLTAALMAVAGIGFYGLYRLEQYLGEEVFDAWAWAFTGYVAIALGVMCFWNICEIIVVSVMAGRGRK